MRVLLTGWFSFERGEATAGDLRAAEVVGAWLDEAGKPYDLATSPVFPYGVDWRAVDPDTYSDVFFVCGPAHGEQLDALLARFADCRLVAVNVSLLPGSRPGFDLVFERDDGQTARPDLALGSPHEPVPVIGVVRSHPQPEYGTAAAHDRAHAVIDRMLADEPVAVVELDTRVDPRELGRQTSASVEAAIARMDAVVTTRLHGLVMALKGGVPAVAVDPIAGGGKVSAQARALGWPHVAMVEDATSEDLRSALRACLRPEAARKAVACRDRAQEDVRRLGSEIMRGVARP